MSLDQNKITLTSSDEKKGKNKIQRASSFSIIIVFFCLSILGVFFIPQLPMKLNPSRQLPVVNVSFSMWNQSARVVEAEVTSKLEAMLNRIRGVRGVSSNSWNGGGSVTIRLSEHVDPDMARFEVSTIIRQAWPSLPDGVSYPSIYMSGTTENKDYTFLRYTVNAAQTPVAIKKYVEENIKNKIAEIKGVDQVEVTGASRMIYKLEYDNEKLKNYNVSLGDLRSSISACLGREFLGIGSIEDENSEKEWIRVALITEDRNQVFDPSIIRVKSSDGTILYLNQLVKVYLEEEESDSSFRINGLNSIYLSITAYENANRITLSKQVQDLLDNMQQSLPDGYELHMSYNESEYIKDELNKIYFRSGLTIFILIFFFLIIYRNLKHSLLIIISLIVNVCIAAIFYYLMDVEMQLYSLAGLTISLTLIIDNTIVMSDQIIQRGNRKAFWAILTATITTMGALLIIFFMGENVRLNLLDFAWVLIINLTLSLVIALCLVPALIEKINIRKKIKNYKTKELIFLKKRFPKFSSKIKGKRKLVYFNRGYEKCIAFTQRWKVLLITLLILAFGLPVFILPDKIESKKEFGLYRISQEDDLGFWANLYNATLGSVVYKESVKPVVDVALGGTVRLFAQKVKTGSYSSGERSETTLNVAASLPNGSTRKQMDNLIKQMENYLSQYPEVRQFETNIQNGQRANIRVLFEKKHQRGAFPHRLKSELIRKANELGGGSWTVNGIGDEFSNEIHETTGSSRMKLLGYNYDELSRYAEAIRDSLLLHRRIKEVTIDSEFSWYKTDYMEFVFNLDKERLIQGQLPPNGLFNSLMPMFERKVHAGDWIANDKREAIFLYSKQAEGLDMWNMENYPGKTSEKEYKMIDIANVEKAQLPQNVAKEDQQYRICIQYEYVGSWQQSWNVLEKNIQIFNENTPLGYKAEGETSRYWWDEGGTSQYWLLLLVIIIIFFTTSILFNSLRQPIVVIFIIPISFIGLFLTFYWFDLNFDQGGFAAFILLAGLSVNANIYILNEYNNIRQDQPGIDPVKAYIKAWNVKIRPIFLTICSTILGFIPFMIGEYREAFWFPLAAGTVGGLIVSLIALFIFLPLFMGIGKRKQGAAMHKK